MKKLLLLIAVINTCSVNAQNYLISFSGKGESTTVNTVKVENLTRGTSLTLNGDNILSLTETTDIYSIKHRQSSELKIYPNPMTSYSILQICPPVKGDAIISVYEMTGRLVIKINSYLENYPQDYSLSGLNNGYYLINVTGSTYQFSGKLLSNGKAGGTIRINKVINNQAVDTTPTKTDSKGAQAIIDMAYTPGDRLKFTGISGIYSTVMIDIPVSDKTIAFNFITCTDGDNNSYPVVNIGSQTWMAENLKTTKFKDGTTSIPNVTDNTAWDALSTPAYCWYNNNEATYKASYGALYNWYALNTRNLCPTGWHVPTDDEWTGMITFLGGGSVAGGKLKEPGTTHWLSPNTGATNESGYTLLPGGYRNVLGTFINAGNYGYLWSSTEYANNYAWYRYIYYSASNVYSMNNWKNCAFSVRCLQDYQAD
jgi:uncharacterized protein (TIGR02145 family)